MAHIFFISLFDEWCLGIRSLLSVLKQSGHQTSLVYLRDMGSMHDNAGREDPSGYHNPPGSVAGCDLERVMELVAQEQPDLIGLGYMSNFQGLACLLTKKLRQACPSTPIAWGGVDATVNPDLAINHADMVFRGESEEAMVEVADAISRKSPLKEIANLWLREGQHIHRNPVRPLIKDLDSLPFPDFSQSRKWYINQGMVQRGVYPPGSHLLTNYPTLTSRGCPFACTYCCNSSYRDLYGARGYVRRHSVEYVLSELENRCADEPHLSFIEFHDDVFTFQTKWVEEFAGQYKSRIGRPFFAYTHPQMCRAETVQALRDCGWEVTSMGIQSGSLTTLERYARKTTHNQIINSAQLVLDAGVQLIVDLIGYNPFESDREMAETLELLLRLPPGFSIHDINPLAFYRNYPLTESARQHGLDQPYLEGRNAFLGHTSPNHRFWAALWSLTQYPSIKSEILKEFSRDPWLKEHPESLEELAAAFRKEAYLPGSFIRKDRHIQTLEKTQAELNGSRAFRLVQKVRGWKSKLR